MVDIALSSACASALRADEPPSATGSCSTKVAPSINRAASPPTPEYFRAIVDDYAREQRAGAKAEMQFYMRQPSLTEAVDVAAKCVLPNGKRHPHQRRIPSTSLVKVRRRLLAVDFRTCQSFDDLHAAVNDAIADIHMIKVISWCSDFANLYLRFPARRRRTPPKRTRPTSVACCGLGAPAKRVRPDRRFAPCSHERPRAEGYVKAEVISLQSTD